MKIHDWSKVDPGLFHHFHQVWASNLAAHLNQGALPDGYYALVEQRTPAFEPDLLTLRTPPMQVSADNRDASDYGDAGVSVEVAPPRVRFTTRTEGEAYARKADRISIRRVQGDVVAIIEIVSPGNKHSRSALTDFIDKISAFLQRGVHILIVDLFPPTSRDPQGIHAVIWREFEDDESFELPPDKPFTLASYIGGPVKTAYVEPVAVGDELTSMPIFLTPERYVPAPLAESYETSWNACPKFLKQTVEAGGVAQ